MKRFMSVFLIVCIALGFAGCGVALSTATTEATDVGGHDSLALLTRVDMGDRWIEYDYNSFGLPVEIREVNKDGILSRRVFTYEDNICLQKQEIYYGDTLSETEEYLREVEHQSQKVTKTVSRNETGAFPTLIEEYTYTEDNYGDEIAQIRSYTEGSGEETRVQYTYNENWQRETVEFYSSDVLQTRTLITYDEEGRTLTGTDYDASGRITGQTLWEYTETTATVRSGPRTTLQTYDEAGNVIRREVWIDGEDAPAICNTYTYRWENLPAGYRAYDFILIQLGLGYGGGIK